jgi:hypothetical protein
MAKRTNLFIEFLPPMPIAKMLNRAGVIYETSVLWWQSWVLTLDLPGIKTQSGLSERLQR